MIYLVGCGPENSGNSSWEMLNEVSEDLSFVSAGDPIYFREGDRTLSTITINGENYDSIFGREYVISDVSDDGKIWTLVRPGEFDRTYLFKREAGTFHQIEVGEGRMTKFDIISPDKNKVAFTLLPDFSLSLEERADQRDDTIYILDTTDFSVETLASHSDQKIHSMRWNETSDILYIYLDLDQTTRVYVDTNERERVLFVPGSTAEWEIIEDAKPPSRVGSEICVHNEHQLVTYFEED